MKFAISNAFYKQNSSSIDQNTKHSWSKTKFWSRKTDMTNTFTWKDMRCINCSRNLGFPNQKRSSLRLNWWSSKAGELSVISTASFTTTRWSLVPISRISYHIFQRQRWKKDKELQRCWRLKEDRTEFTYNGRKEGKPKVNIASWM